MQYFVKVEELKLKIDYYKKLLAEIKENIKYLNDAKNSIIWEGHAHNVFINYYDNYIVELKKIAFRIILLINFLSSYCDNYGYEYLRLRDKYKSMDDWSDEKIWEL